jgi:hypothetical protein
MSACVCSRKRPKFRNHLPKADREIARIHPVLGGALLDMIEMLVHVVRIRSADTDSERTKTKARNVA